METQRGSAGLCFLYARTWILEVHHALASRAVSCFTRHPFAATPINYSSPTVLQLHSKTLYLNVELTS